jgi:hypothetical protein
MEVSVKRRISFVAALAAAGSLCVGVGMSVAAAAQSPKPTLIRCALSLTTIPPSGQASVDQPATQGKQYGPAHCHQKGFGWGVDATTFTVPDSGDTVGTYVQYMQAGTITGSFDLTPDESQPLDPGNFLAQSWTGTVTITSGTGIYKGIKAQKKTGVLTCTTTDSVHLSCKQKIKAFLPATVG